MSDSKDKDIRTLASIFTAATAIALLVTVVEYFQARDFLQHLGQQSGVVLAVQEKIVHRKSGWKDGVQASFEVSGQNYTVDTLRDHGGVHTGDAVNVVYDARDPAGSARIGEPQDIWLRTVPPGVMSLMLGFFSAIVWVNFLFMRRASAKADLPLEPVE